MCTEKVLQSDESIEKWTTTTTKSSYIPKKSFAVTSRIFWNKLQKRKMICHPRSQITVENVLHICDSHNFRPKTKVFLTLFFLGIICVWFFYCFCSGEWLITVGFLTRFWNETLDRLWRFIARDMNYCRRSHQQIELKSSLKNNFASWIIRFNFLADTSIKRD